MDVGKLVLGRRLGESIRVDGPCLIEVVQLSGGYVRLAIHAERSVRIVRTEIDGQADGFPASEAG